MFRNERLEIKVGLFIGIGLGLMFIFAFLISDSYLWGKGYNLNILFNYVNGITENAPVRLAGVNVGQVEKINVLYDEDLKKTKVDLLLWIKEGVKISKDSVARINTLGLLGEQYLEITPGTSGGILKNGAFIEGKDPVNVGQQMEKMGELANTVSRLFGKIEEGKGTLGKLINDDELYNNLNEISRRLERGEGTIGRLLVEDDVYENLKDFSGDIRSHPWKLIYKTSGNSDRKRDTDKDEKTGNNFGPR